MSSINLASAVPVPSGCRWCGVDQRGHFRRWSSAADEQGHTVGWHVYTLPTEEQIKARMYARRAGVALVAGPEYLGTCEMAGCGSRATVRVAGARLCDDCDDLIAEMTERVRPLWEENDRAETAQAAYEDNA